MSPRFFYGWLVTLASGFGIACSFAVLIPTTLGMLAMPLGQEFGWSVSEIMAANIFATGIGVVISPFVGALVDRVGVRKVIVISFLIEALIIFSFRFLNHSLALFYLRYAAFSLFCSGCTAIGFTTVISRWFHRNRGLALGVALAGTGLGGVLWSLAVNWLFHAIGWRDAFVWFAAFVGLVATPLIFLILRDDPSQLHLQVDGDPPGTISKIDLSRGFSLRQASKTTIFWQLLAVSFLVAFGVQSIMFNLVPIIKRGGDPHNIAGLIQASLWASLIVGRIFTGWLLDRFFAARVATAFLVLPMIGALLFAYGAHGALAFAAAMLIGLSAGAEVDIFAYMASRYFGLRYYSRIYGVCFSLFALGAGIGPMTTARVAQTSGYPSALWMLTGSLLLACVLLSFFRRFPTDVAQPVPGPTLSMDGHGSAHS